MSGVPCWLDCPNQLAGEAWNSTGTPRLRAFSSLLPASSPAIKKSVFFETLLAARPPFCTISFSISSREYLRSAPVTTIVLLAKTPEESMASSGDVFSNTPFSRSWRISSAPSSLRTNEMTLCAIVGPISSICPTVSISAETSASISPKVRANTNATRCPTCRIEIALSTRVRPRLLLASMP